MMPIKNWSLADAVAAAMAANIAGAANAGSELQAKLQKLAEPVVEHHLAQANLELIAIAKDLRGKEVPCDA